MKSISQALLWESCRHWHSLFVGFIGAVLVPFLVLGSLRSLGLPPEAREFLTLHVFLMPVLFLILSAGIIAMQGPIQRLYRLPISNASIAFWIFLSGNFCVALGIGSSIVWFDTQFQVPWPVLGPTLYSIMAFSVVQPWIRIAHKTPLTVFMTLVAAILLAVVFVSRYGGFSKTPSVYWMHPSTSEIVGIFCVTVISFVAFTRCIAMDRHGDDRTDPLQRLINYLCSPNWAERIRFERFSSQFSAHSWYLWKSQGWSYPLVVAGMLLFSSILWYAQSDVEYARFKPDPELRLELVSTLGWLIFLAMPFGIGLGMSNPDSSTQRRAETLEETIRNVNTYRMGSFLSALPMGNELASRTILATAAKASLIAVAMTLIAFLTMSLVRVDIVSGLWTSSYAGWYWLGLLWMPWAAMTCTATLGLFGRSQWLVIAVIASICGCVLIALPSTQGWFLMFLAIIAILIAIITSVAAVRLHVLSNSALATAMSAWLVLITLIYVSRPVEISGLIFCSMIVLTTAAILPIVMMPVAISYNRHR